MTLFITILVILFAAVALTRVAYGLAVPYPSLLALGGALVALIPGLPAIKIEPDLALAIFVAPVLLDAAYDTSVRDLKDNWTAITGLVVVAVGVTTVAVAFVFHALAPAAPWAAAVALGAIVAPPDASAASTILRQVKLPNRLIVILEGEGLLNDATALLILAVALSFVAAPNQTLMTVLPAYVASVAGSVVAGVALGWLYPRITSFLEYAPASIVMQFAGTFGVWILAQKTGLSPILTIVTYGITIARYAPRRSNPFNRVQSYAVWDTIVYLMNVLAFVVIGLQLRQLLGNLDPSQVASYLFIALAVLATVIAVRIAWVMTFNTALRWKNRTFGTNLAERMMPPTFDGGLIIAWCGMRGIVTLGAALSLPPDFPQLGLIQLCAFGAAFGTLVLQGFTVGPLANRLTLPKDDHVARETDNARTAALTAALRTIDGNQSPYAEALRIEYEAILAQDDTGPDGERQSLTEHERLRVKAVAAARKAIEELRTNGDIGDEAFHKIEEALDRTELYALRYADRP